MPALFRRYAGALAHRDFRLLVAAFVIDSIGSWAASVVLAVYVFDRTGSVTLLAALAAARWIPGLLMGAVAGVLADRYERAGLMAASAAASGMVAVGVCFVIGFEGPVWMFLVLQVASAVANSPYRPAAGALTPEVVGEDSLPAANSLFAALENLVIVIGPAIGGLLLVLGQPLIAIGLNAASFFVAAGIARSLTVRSRGTAVAGENVLTHFRDGVQALRATPTAAVLLVFAALATLLAGAFTVVYIPISQHLGTGSSGYGYLLVAAAVGGVAGAAVADRLSAARRLAPIIVGGLLLESLPYAITPFTSSPVVGSLLQAVSGVGMVFVDVLALTAMQREIPGGRLSRVLGLLDTVALLASVIGTFAVSALLSSVSYRTALLVLGLGIAAVALMLSPLVIAVDRRTVEVAGRLAERASLLSRVGLFTGSSRQVLERLAAAAEPAEIPAGHRLIREGDPAEALWVLAEGSLMVTATTSTAITIPDVSAPDVVGEIGVLRGMPRTATVTARTDCTVWRIAADSFLTAAEPERRSLALLGPLTARLARTHPELLPDNQGPSGPADPGNGQNAPIPPSVRDR